MATFKRRLHIICYDITEPKRLGRIHRYLRRRGLRIQYSVFVLHTHTPGLLRILNDLHALIDPREDDIRSYPLPSRLDYTHIGRALLPAGVYLHSLKLPSELFESSAPASNDQPPDALII